MENIDYDTILLNLKNLLSYSVEQAIGSEKETGVVFSAGIDSTVIAFLAKKFCNITAYTVGTDGCEDIVFARKFEKLDLINTKIVVITENDVENEIKNIVKILNDNKIEITRLNLSTAVPLYFASKKANEDCIKVMLSGQGADEIFGGYARYLRMCDDEREDAMKRDIENAYKENLYRDAAMCAFNKICLKFPYLEKNFLDCAMNIPMEFKIYEVKNDECPDEFAETIDIVEGKKFIRKFILRKLGVNVGVPEFIVKRKKKAMQYGSKSEKIIEKILKEGKISV
ncbi:MAG: hypothetical protein BWK75_04210 [Candidatus Altiarchaeales archaeon A3]|nr:MAG: hypothetical protein BWK75_04210 [Candidatus Altiarchaeales archaeon A3]